MMGKNRRRNAERRRTQYSGLEAHKREGKKLVAPWNTVSNFRHSSWINDRLPEMVWAALLIKVLGRNTALDAFRRIIGIYRSGEKYATHGISLTGFSELPPEVTTRIFEGLALDRWYAVALRPLLLFEQLPLREGWKNFINMDPEPEDWELLMETVAAVLNHQSETATDCRWLWIVGQAVTEKINLVQDLKHIADELIGYPDVGDMKKVKATVRALEIGMFSMESKTDWPDLFWKECLDKTPCLSLAQAGAAPLISEVTVTEIDYAHEELVRNFQESMTTTDIDVRHETIHGMTLYALDIMKEVINSSNSTGIVGRLGLRTLIEIYITLAFLVEKDEETTWHEYRNYGAGQAKLAYLKLDRDEVVEKPKFVSLETLESIANEDRWMEFNDVHLGNWGNTDLRKMSETAKVKDQYDLFYPWTSGFVHGNWAAIRNVTLDVCVNPLHRLHRILKTEPYCLEDVIEDCCSVVNRILEMFGRLYPGSVHRLGDSQQAE